MAPLPGELPPQDPRHLADRNIERGEAARDEIAKSFPEAELHVDRCDLSSMDNVQAFAAAYARTKRRRRAEPAVFGTIE
jgi:hypothetical protein